MTGMFSHQDLLSPLDQNLSLGAKLGHLHDSLKQRFPFLERVACAIHDPATDMLKTFLSSGPATGLSHYQSRLADSASLSEIVRNGRPRVVNNLAVFRPGINTPEPARPHTQAIAGQGFRASYTMPIFSRGVFFGFIFFNALQEDVFTDEVLNQIDPFGHLLALVILQDLSTLRTLLASVKTARDFMGARDQETGCHLDRMSRYARLIAHPAEVEDIQRRFHEDRLG